MSQTGDLVLKGSKIVILKALQDRATKLGHEGHQGVEKTKSLLREKIWYPGMDDKVKKVIENCVACQAVGPNNPSEPMRITPTATEPWQSFGNQFLRSNTAQWTILTSCHRDLFLISGSGNCQIDINQSLYPEAEPHICHSWYTLKDKN